MLIPMDSPRQPAGGDTAATAEALHGLITGAVRRMNRDISLTSAAVLSTVALTAAGADYLRARRRAGADAFAALIAKLPAAEAQALLAATPALQHLRDLDSERSQ